MKAREIAQAVGGKLLGDPDAEVVSPAPLEEAGPQNLTFAFGKAWKGPLGVVITDKEPEKLEAKAVIVVSEPRLAMAKALSLFVKESRKPGIHPTAIIHPKAEIEEGVSAGPWVFVGEGAKLGKGVVLEAGVFVGRGAEIGDDTYVGPWTYIHPGTKIGKRVRIGPGCVLGWDGFGYALTSEGPVKIPQLGRVVIEDDVELGACVTVDRATLGETRICRGAKLDNLVQVAHNVRIGPGSVIAAQSGIAGSSRLGAGVVLAGQVGVADHVEVADGVIITAKSGVAGDLREPGIYSSGIPARPRLQFLKAVSLFYRLTELFERLKRVEEKLNEKEDPGEAR